MIDAHPSRRDIFRLGGGALALNSLSSLAQAEGTHAHINGYVSDALTGKGLPQIRVSNGRDIVFTDASGHYTIPPNGSAPIFMIKPSGWSPSINQSTMLPQNHQNPTFDEHVNFSLSPTIESDAFEVIMFADPQPANDTELGYLRAQIANGPVGSKAAFGITLGDLVGDNASLYERYNQIISQIGLPWWNLPGNHDLDFSADTSSKARAHWRRVFGPTTYAFEYGAATFVMLDNINWAGKAAGANPYSGQIGAENLTFVESLLNTTPPDRLIVLCMHIPLISANDPSDPGSNTSDRDALLALISDRPCVSFAGHLHTTEHHYLPLPNGGQHHHHILTALSGSWWSGPMDPLGQPMAQSCDGAPNGWHMLSVNGTDYSTRFVSAREPSQMRIMLTCDGEPNAERKSRKVASTTIGRTDLKDTKIVINIFDGGPRTTVYACVSGCSASITKRAPRHDPMTQDLFEQAGTTKKPWVQAERSSHIWQAELPADLPSGLHRLNVTAENEYGQIHHGAMIFEVRHG